MKLTQRKVNGFYIYFSIFVVTFVSSFTVSNIDDLNYFLGVINFQLERESVISIASILNISLLIPLFLIWCVRNKVWEGKAAFKRYFLTLNLRRALLDARYHDERFFGQHVAKIPDIKIDFDDKKSQTGKLFIRDSIEFHQRLEKAILTPALKHYKIENSYVSDDGNWFVYEFYNVSAQFQKRFDSLNDYLSWANYNATKYDLRYDERLATNLKHLLLVGATRSGKTYALLGLVLQMINKPINYHMYFADPKNDQIRKVGNWINSKKTAVTTNEIIELIEEVFHRLIEREKEMELATFNRITGDYRDVNLEPIILVFDEFSSFISVLDSKQKKVVLGHLTAIVQRGAGAGLFLYLIMQKSESTTLPTSIRSNLLLKIVLGNAASTTYTTAFESSADIPEYKFSVGQGVFMDDTMSKPKLISFPYLKFLDAYNDGTKDPAELWLQDADSCKR